MAHWLRSPICAADEAQAKGENDDRGAPLFRFFRCFHSSINVQQAIAFSLAEGVRPEAVATTTTLNWLCEVHGADGKSHYGKTGEEIVEAIGRLKKRVAAEPVAPPPASIPAPAPPPSAALPPSATTRHADKRRKSAPKGGSAGKRAKGDTTDDAAIAPDE